MLSVQGHFRTKKGFKEATINSDAAWVFLETSAFGPEYKGDGTYSVVGPSPTIRKWYATAIVKDGKVVEIS